MSSYLNSYFIEPALRQARRFSSPRPDARDQLNLGSHAPDTSGDEAALEATDSADTQQQPAHIGHRRQRSSEPGQLSLSNLREVYSNEQDTYRAEEVADTERDANIARHNGLQGLLPLSDVRSNYLADQESIDSPVPMEAQRDQDIYSPRRLREQDTNTLDSLSGMSIDDTPTMTSNPSHAATQDVMSIGGSSISSRRRRSGGRGPGSRRQSGHRDTMGSLQMSTNLPEDDGMKIIRAQMHQIREMALSSEEKAARMHALMTADYEKLKAFQSQDKTTWNGLDQPYNGEEPQLEPLDNDTAHNRAGSRTSTSSTGLRKSSMTVNAEDLIPTFQPRPVDKEGPIIPGAPQADGNTDDLPLGCAHYRRNVKIQCPDCWKWYTCRHCHDAVEKHSLVRNRIKNMLCIPCGTPQPAAEYCSQCSRLTAAYYCDICKLWDNDTEHHIYHCPDCGICRLGRGLGKDYVHCKRCNVCINIAYTATHRCVERATECDCPICGEWMFTSSMTVVAVECGHYMHRPCYDALMRTSFKCPICNRSAVNMELQWRKLDHAIEAQPMPSQFKETKVWITCNDCSARTCTGFHWLGNKCTQCDSYNTNQFKMINSPSDQELQALQESQSQEVQALRAAEQQMGTQNGNAATNVPQRATQDPNEAQAVPPATVAAPGPRPIWRPSQEHVQQMQQPYHADPVSPPTAIPPTTRGLDPNSYFPPHSPSNRGSATDENDDLEMTDPSYSDTEDEQESVADDVGFWGEPVSPSLRIPSMPSPSGWSMPSIPASVPRPDWHLPSVSMPSMPRMPSVSMSMPQMPQMPDFSMPRAISPTTIWAAGSPTFSGWNLPSPNFFPLRRGATNDDQHKRDNEDGDDDDDEYEEDEYGSDLSSSAESGRMDLEGEEDGDVDEMELFGHR